MNENQTVGYWKCVIVEFIMDGNTIHDEPIKIAECLAEHYKRSSGTLWNTYAQIHGNIPTSKVYNSIFDVREYDRNRIPI